MKNKEFEIQYISHESGLHDYTILKRWFASDWYYCPYCLTLFDEYKKVYPINSASVEIVELVNRINKKYIKTKPKG